VSHAANKIARFIAVIFGAFLVVVGAYVFFYSEAPLHWTAPTAIVLVSVGANLIYSVFRAKRSWLSRIGPLP